MSRSRLNKELAPAEARGATSAAAAAALLGELSASGRVSSGAGSTLERRLSTVREQFARVSRGEEMDDPDLAVRSAEIGKALDAVDGGFGGGGGGGGGRRRIMAKTAADLTGRTGSYMCEQWGRESEPLNGVVGGLGRAWAA